MNGSLLGGFQKKASFCIPSDAKETEILKSSALMRFFQNVLHVLFFDSVFQKAKKLIDRPINFVYSIFLQEFGLTVVQIQESTIPDTLLSSDEHRRCDKEPSAPA